MAWFFRISDEDNSRLCGVVLCLHLAPIKISCHSNLTVFLVLTQNRPADIGPGSLPAGLGSILEIIIFKRSYLGFNRKGRCFR